MFTNSVSEVVGFSSIHYQKSENSTSESQTNQTEFEDGESQAPLLTSTGIQTEANSTEKTVNYNESHLQEFIVKVAPMVLEELDLEQDWTQDDRQDQEITPSVTALQTYSANPEFSHKVNCLSWNRTGGTLAVGFSVHRHDTWCNHETKLAVYRSSKCQTFNTTSCITAMSFHPLEPSVMATGMYTGELIIWDLRKDDDWKTEESGPPEHTDRVIFIGWTDEGTCITAGADGCIIVRKVNLTTRNIHILERFEVGAPLMGFNIRLRMFFIGQEGVEITACCQVWGETCVVGIAGEGLLHCSFGPLQPISSRTEYKNPVLFSYAPHRTFINSIRPAVSGKRFATGSSDGQIRIYASMTGEPEYILNMKESVWDLFWTDNPMVLGYCASEDKVAFVKFTTSQILDTEFEIPDKQIATAIMPTKRCVAVGDAAGNVHIFKVILDTK